MKTGRLGRVGVATVGLAAMVTSALAFSAAAPSEADVLAAAHAEQFGITSILRVKAETPERVQLLGEQFDLAEYAHEGWHDVVAYPGDQARLDTFGFTYQTVTENLVALDIAQRLLERDLAQELAKQGPTDLQPGERTSGYRTLADFEADIKQLAADNPGFVRLLELPNKTHQGRTVYGLQIAGNPDAASSDGRPTSLLMGLHHAREWPSAEMTIMFAYHVIEQYNAGDKEITDTINAGNFLVVPVVNPDGYVRSRETVSDWIAPLPGAAAAGGEFAYHRKNMRPHPDTGDLGLLGQGTDPNRNYPYKWGGPGTSTSTGSATYHGPGPASEPEIQNILSLLRANHITTLISNHTYSNLVLRPFGDTMRDTPDEAIIKGHADAMAAINGYSSIKGLELYATTGTTEDWVYGVTGAPSFTFEIGGPGVVLGNITPAECDGFHPTYQLCVGDFFLENRDAYILNLKQSQNNAWHSRLTGSAPAGTVLNLVKEINVPLSIMVDGDDFMSERLDASMVVGKDGTFTWHVNPSPMPQTILDIEDGFVGKDWLETYTLTATLPNGKVVKVNDLLVERGEVYDFAF